MRVLVQRVDWAEVEVAARVVGRVDRGLLVYVAVAPADTSAEADWLAEKITHLRIFEDEQGKLNRSVRDEQGGVLVVSNFTLLADARRGRRPSFDGAARADLAAPLTEAFVEALRRRGCPVLTGQFGAEMFIRSQACGPVNLIIETPAGSSR